MGWVHTKTDDQNLLDSLWSQAQYECCLDCGTNIGALHKDGCDIARCAVCGLQMHENRTKKTHIYPKCVNPKPMERYGRRPGLKTAYLEGRISIRTGEHNRFEEGQIKLGVASTQEILQEYKDRKLSIAV